MNARENRARTAEEVGALLGMTHQRVHQIECAVLRKMRQRMTDPSFVSELAQMQHEVAHWRQWQRELAVAEPELAAEADALLQPMESLLWRAT